MFQPQYTISHERQDQRNTETQDTPADPPEGVSCFFPATRGVVEFQAHDGSTLLLAATGHIRDFIAQRLNEAGEPSAKADLAPVTARIHAHHTGSALESDLFVLERSRTVDPDLHAKLTHQNRRALLVLCPATGTWRTAETNTLQIAQGEHVIGPCLTSKSAQQLGETLDDVFELCRFPKELALAPRGTPCAYKEMGRCPAACDGSEPLETYHQRFTQAIHAAKLGPVAWAAHLKADMQQASADLDFEAAAHAKRHLDAVSALPRDTLAHAASLHTFACVIVTPTPRTGWAQCWAFNALGCIPVCSIELLDNELLHALPDLLRAHLSPMGFDQPQLDRFALIARHWLTKPTKQRKRRVTILDARDENWPTNLRHAIDAAQTASDPGHDDEEHTLLPV